MYKGISISELLKRLKVTKQSLNRVLKDLIKLEIIFFKKDDQDTRVKHIILNEKGERVFTEIFEVQKKRIHGALLNSSSEEVVNFDKVLKKIINYIRPTAICATYRGSSRKCYGNSICSAKVTISSKGYIRRCSYSSYD